MSRWEKIRETVRALLEGERVAVVCRSASDTERFFRDVVNVTLLVCGLEGVSMTSHHDHHTIERGDGLVLIMTWRRLRGIAADTVIVDELDETDVDVARQCVVPRGGRVVE